MNTAAPIPPAPAAHAQAQIHHNNPDSFSAERISAQEAMKTMRISEPHQSARRRKSSEMDDGYAASRVDRHLANRAQSVRESSSKYHYQHPQQQHQQQPCQPNAQPNTAASGTERCRRSKDDYSTQPPNDWVSAATLVEDNNVNNQHHHHHQRRESNASTATATTVTSTTQQQQQYRQPHHHNNNNSNYCPTAPSDEQQPSSPAPPTPASPAPSSASGRQSRMSNAGSSRESYRRKYGGIPGYSYIGTIGQGNFGKVLLAENDLTGEQVAVKILEKSQFKSEQQRLHATREARLMKTLRHPNIVDVKDVLEDEHRILIIMENLTGGELFDYISNKGSLEEKEARRIFHQIVLAIHHCHEKQVVHRDLKPENILLDSEKNVRVADFGFGNHWHKDRHLTTYCGSPFYAAPEMVSGTPYIGPETDVWSLGVILYVLVCGRLPFDAGDLPQLFAQIKRGSYQKPREGSIDVCSLIHRMLTVDPKRRATLTDVLRSRWMRAEGMDLMVTALPALSTAPSTIRPAPSRPIQPAPMQQQPIVQQPQQARSAGLNTFHPNNDISATMATATSPAPSLPPTVVTQATYHHYSNSHHHSQAQTPQHHRHSYHPPGAHDVRPLDVHSPPFHPQQQQQQYQHQYQQQQPIPALVIQTPISPADTLVDDHMSDASASMTNSPTETMATISPSTPVGPTRDDALALAAATYQQKRSNSYDEKHHPYKNHTRANSTHHNNQGAVTINMCPSTDALMDGFDSSSKKKRKALTKLRQFFRFETNKC